MIAASDWGCTLILNYFGKKSSRADAFTSPSGLALAPDERFPGSGLTGIRGLDLSVILPSELPENRFAVATFVTQ